MTKPKLIIALFLAVFIMSFAKPLLSEDNYKVQYVAEFSHEELSFEKLMGYDNVRLKDGEWLSDLAKPMLPSKEFENHPLREKFYNNPDLPKWMSFIFFSIKSFAPYSLI